MYDKQTSKEVEESTNISLQGDFENIEVGSVDGLMEMYKLRELIAKTKAEIIAEALQAYSSTHLGTIENIVIDKRLELDRQKEVEGSLMISDYLILQHAAMKYILENKYDLLMNAIIYDSSSRNF